MVFERIVETAFGTENHTENQVGHADRLPVVKEPTTLRVYYA